MLCTSSDWQSPFNHVLKSCCIRTSLFRFYPSTTTIAEDGVVWIFLSAFRTCHLLFAKRLLNTFARCLKRSIYVLGGCRESLLQLSAHFGKCHFQFIGGVGNVCFNAFYCFGAAFRTKERVFGKFFTTI